jgi:hypothetical protein
MASPGLSVIKIGERSFDIFLQGEYTPRGFQSQPGEEWGLMVNVGTMLPNFKFGPHWDITTAIDENCTRFR